MGLFDGLDMSRLFMGQGTPGQSGWAPVISTPDSALTKTATGAFAGINTPVAQQSLGEGMKTLGAGLTPPGGGSPIAQGLGAFANAYNKGQAPDAHDPNKTHSLLAALRQNYFGGQ